MMNFKDAQEHFASWKWQLHEETFEHLDETTFICKVTTAWRVAKGESAESTFYLLFDENEHRQQQFSITEGAMQGLFRWANPEMERRMSIDQECYVKDLGRHRMEHDEQIGKLRDTLSYAETGLKLALDVLPMQGMARENATVALAQVQQRLKEMENASEL